MAASTVSAADNITGDVVSVDDETDFVQINVENQSDETITIENNEMDSLESTDNDKISDSPGTFTDLSNDIKSGKILSRDYINTENKEINVLNSYINGNGHTIDFNNYYTNAFHFTYSNSITIKNCNFVNGTYAVRWDQFSENNAITIENCNFTNCGGILLSSSSSSNTYYMHLDVIIKNCYFFNSIGVSSSFSINPLSFCYYTIENCIFSGSKQGAIDVDNFGSNKIYFNIIKCSFVNNTNQGNGGAIRIDVDKESNSYASCELNITDSIFINNSASNTGGAIYSNMDKIEIHNSKFISNNAIKGAAIYITAINKNDLYVKINMDNSLFLDNSGALDDGIYVEDITHLSEGRINNCILLGSEYGSNPIVYSEKEFDGNYNWWGNTFDNPRQKPANVNKLVVQKWLVLNITSIGDMLYVGDIAQIKCNLSSIIDYIGNMNSYDYSNVLSVDFIAESLGMLDTFPFVSGYGEYNFTLNNSPISTLTIKCGNFQKTINFNVNKKTDLIVEVPDSCDDGKKLIINLPTNATGNITLIINNKTYNSTINDGKAIIDLSELPNGTYDYEINYSGNKIYNPFKSNGNLKVGHIATINANDMETTYGEQSYFIATFYESNGAPLSNKYVAFKINNDETPIKTDSNGVAKLPIELNPGEYNITSINDYTGESIVNKLIVKAADPKPIDDKNIVIPSLDGGSGTVILPNDANGIITLDIAGKPYNFTVVNGVCDVQLPELDNGFYGYVLTYSGDSKYTSFTKTGSFTISKPITPTNQNNSNTPTNQNTPTSTTKKVAKTTISLKTVKVKKSAKKLVLQATLKKGSKALSGKKITFKFNGKKYTAKTNKKGIAKVTIKKNVLKKLKVGKKVKYQASYGNAIAKKTAKVKK
ncbi:hypothetical protein [Methanobrevibacter sp.]|uniref:hypothetical protein n=1 Tax=Methanobrevibacter sp. TaxID=66852 RepID=UPI00386B54E3